MYIYILTKEVMYQIEIAIIYFLMYAWIIGYNNINLEKRDIVEHVWLKQTS